MIRSFKDKLTEDLFNNTPNFKIKKIDTNIKEIAIRKLDLLNAAVELKDLKSPPGNKLKKLTGDFKDYHSIRVNDQYRIIFQWKNNSALLVSFTDYH